MLHDNQLRLDAPHGEARVSVLVAAYDEEPTIGQVLDKLISLTDIDLAEIVVVDDGSRDRTAEIVEEVATGDGRVRLIRHEQNLGKTAAIARAIAAATGDILIVQDADLEYDPTEIHAVVAPILDGRADVVYGSRFLVRRAARTVYFYHYLANRLLTFLSDLLTNRNMTDIETGYKAFRAGLIKPLRLTSKGFGMEAEITAMVCKTSARTYEVPISYYGRTYGEGKKVGMIDGVMAFCYVLYYNLIAPWLPSGRAYVREANRFLETDTVLEFRLQPGPPPQAPPTTADLPRPSRPASGCPDVARSVPERRSDGLPTRKEPAMSRKAFSLVELLVVLGIIGILITLLLPAIQSAREAARRLQCQNNMKQLATACLAYHDSLGGFPPAMTVPTKGSNQDRDPGDTNKWGANWVINILPFCEYNSLHHQFDLTKPISDPANATARATPVPTMLCPSDAAYNRTPYNPARYKREGKNWARGNYGANGAISYLSDYLEYGAHTGNPEGPFAFLGPNSPGWTATGGTAAGAIPLSRGVMGCNEACSLTQITDGASHTIMLGELRAGTTPVDRRGTWAMGTVGASSLWGHGAWDDHGPNCDIEGADDMKYGPEIATAAGGGDVLWFQGMGCNPIRIKNTQATARSQHPGGVNVVLCDASVHFISDSIDHGSNTDPADHVVPSDPKKLHVWERLNVSCDGQPIDNNTW